MTGLRAGSREDFESRSVLRSPAISPTARRECRLTPRSTGAATAGHQARAGGTRYIFASPGLASCRCSPVSSNVRPGNSSPQVATHAPSSSRVGRKTKHGHRRCHFGRTRPKNSVVSRVQSQTQAKARCSQRTSLRASRWLPSATHAAARNRLGCTVALPPTPRYRQPDAEVLFRLPPPAGKRTRDSQVWPP